ncbi:sensor histidine kinase [Ectobacillus funiculus]|uniref:histidine kinase n=1 Tax=Ectobacillus funiculus TaxID=137993 RepID=A0ABV5WQW8_9BACI
MPRLTMVQKLWLTISCAVLLTVSLLYLISIYSYQKLYVQHIEDTLQTEGRQLAAEYKGSLPDFEQKVQWFNSISKTELLFVSNPRDLSACLPFDVQYNNAIITEEDRQELLNGNTVTKVGFEERFHRQIMGVIIPVLEKKKLIGIVYSYIPLKSIKDLILDLAFVLAPLAIGLILLMAWVGRKIVIAITKPLSQMERVSYQMSKGDFTERIPITTNDEIGLLASAFNSMAHVLQKEDLQRKEFLANISHELRTPLSYIKGYSEAILDGISKPEQQVKFIRLIHKEAGRMQRLVHDLLDLAQLEGDLFPLNKQPTAFAQLVEDTLETYEQGLLEKRILLKTELNPEIISYIDEDRMRQVIHNVMDNAIRYTPEGGTISVVLLQQEKMCVLRISDTGKGIPAHHVQRLGERFYRVDKARSRQNGGTGLGLAIVKQIVEVHGGALCITSKEDQGTTIAITLPMAE